jgi:hypothetical protein
VPTPLQAPGVGCFRREQSIYVPAASRGHFNFRLFVCARVVCAVELINDPGEPSGDWDDEHRRLARASRMVEPLSPDHRGERGCKLEREPTITR